jgi:hypothetical protein
MRKWISKKTLRKLYDELVIDHSNLMNDYDDMADRKDAYITFLEAELKKERAKNVVLKKDNEFLRKQEKVKQTSPLEIAKKARAGWYGE